MRKRIKMTKLLLSGFLLITSLGVINAQEGTGNTQPQKQATAGQIFTNHHAKTYQLALRYNDYQTAKDALYDLFVENPNNDSILFSLSNIYFQMQQYASAALTANDIIARNPDHLGALEISATSLENLGARDKALDAYESLYLKSDDVQVLYKIAFLQFELQRYAESLTNADILLGKKELDGLTVVFNTEDQKQKEYPIKVALHNLKGSIYKAQNNNEKAKEFFQKALEIAPDFKLAKDNLASLDK